MGTWSFASKAHRRSARLTLTRRSLSAALLALVGAALASCSQAHSSVDSTDARTLRVAMDTARLVSTGDSVRVPILVYHSVAHHHAGQTGEQRELDVDTSVFRAQMAYIARRRLPVIGLSDLVGAIDRHESPPAGAVVITFDDGWQDQYDEAFPVLQRYRFTATFFVYTNAIGNGPAFMTWDELRSLERAGMTIGAHSRTHPMLTKANVSLPDEINGSRADIERNLGVTPDLFAYPYGDWDRRVADAVRAAGFRAAREMGDGPLNRSTDLFALRSILVTDDMQEFEHALSPQAKWQRER